MCGKAVVITALAACKGQKRGTAASAAAFVGKDDTLLMTLGTKAPLDGGEFGSLLFEIVDIDSDRTDQYDQ